MKKVYRSRIRIVFGMQYRVHVPKLSDANANTHRVRTWCIDVLMDGWMDGCMYVSR
jgi:hypothetical protein